MLIKISYSFLIYLSVLFSLNLINSNEIEYRNSIKNSKESTAVEKKSGNVIINKYLDLTNFNDDVVNNKSENKIVSLNGAQPRIFDLFLNKTTNIASENYKKDRENSDSGKLVESEVLAEFVAEVKLQNVSASMTKLKPKLTIQIEPEILNDDFKNHSTDLGSNSRKIIPKMPTFDYRTVIKKFKNNSAILIVNTEGYKDEYVKNTFENVDAKKLTQNSSNVHEEFTNLSITDSGKTIKNEPNFSNDSVIKLCQNSNGTELKESFESELKNISDAFPTNSPNIETPKNTEIFKNDSNVEFEKNDYRNSSGIKFKNSTQIDSNAFMFEKPKKNDSIILMEIPNENGKEILKNISKICGGQLTRRISFGVETTLLQYPWSALLVYNTTERYHCGATLITHQYVLTAAHCVSQYYYPLIAVRLGEHNLTSEIDCAPSLTGEPICNYNTFDIGIERVIIHEGFSRRHYKNDISLLRLEYAIQFSNAINPICLPQFKAFDEIPTLTRGTVTGWGATEKSLHSNVLMQADIPILSISKCHEIYRRSFNESLEICASGANEVDVCKGDSGGPLFRREYLGGRREKFVQVGIISLGALGCGDQRFLPAVFTRVLAYMQWIEDNLYY